MNKRQNDRRHLIDFLEIFDFFNDSFFGLLVDVTLQGVKVTTKNPLEVGNTVTLKIKIPKFFNTKNEITFEATCVWTNRIKDSYESGLKFKRILDEDLDVIKNLFL